MTERTLFQQIIEEFVTSIKDDELMNSSIMKVVANISEGSKPINKKDMLALLNSED
jgi:hypothetical protein